MSYIYYVYSLNQLTLLELNEEYLEEGRGCEEFRGCPLMKLLVSLTIVICFFVFVFFFFKGWIGTTIQGENMNVYIHMCVCVGIPRKLKGNISK